MEGIASSVTPFVTAAGDTLKHYVTLVTLALSLAFYNLRTTLVSWCDHAQDWYAAQQYLAVTTYSRVATSSAQGLARHYRALGATSKLFLDDCSAKATVVLAQLSVAALALARQMTTALVDNVTWATNKLWCLWLSLRTLLYYSQTQLIGTFYHLERLAVVSTKAAKVLAIKAWTAQRFVGNNAGAWLVASLGRLRNTIVFLDSRLFNYSEALLHHWRAFGHRYLYCLPLIYIVVHLIHARQRIREPLHFPRMLFTLIVLVYHDFTAPMSQLEHMHLEVVLRNTLPGSYVYDFAKFKQWPRIHNFSSTLQMHRPRKPLNFFSLPPGVRAHIFHLALTSTTQFSWMPLRRVLRLETPNIDFHRIWSVARSLGYYLPANTINIDACAAPPPPSLPRPATCFVPPKACGRHQLMEMLSQLSRPAIESKLWMESVAASMRAGMPWDIVVKESWHRVWSYDIGLIVTAICSDYCEELFGNVMVEYRIVVGDDEKMDVEKKENKMLDLVRQLRESVQLGYRDEYVKVTVEGLEAWDGLMGTHELEGRLVVEAVREVVAEMNSRR
ncbi:hypothetical protein SLS55_002903 [Diplodia seriata]|uniref:Uncharacterized protein n=1 Tax=Diplodia seriata TaxID=420778 RepID=A0ABR3CLG5_9PEZI